MNERVGVYICHCGTNIAKTVDVKEVARWAREQEHVEICSRLPIHVLQPRPGPDRGGHPQSTADAGGGRILLTPHARKDIPYCLRARRP